MKIVLNGCFDILHSGHKYIIMKAAQWSWSNTATLPGRLLILINSDKSVKELKGEGRPIFNEQARIEAIYGFLSNHYPLNYVEVETFETEEELLEKINIFQPDIIMKGNDRPNTLDIVGSSKWPVCIVPRIKDKEGKDISTSSIVKSKQS